MDIMIFIDGQCRVCPAVAELVALEFSATIDRIALTDATSVRCEG